MCAEVNENYLYVVHHEMGHCQYYLAYNTHQPELFQVTKPLVGCCNKTYTITCSVTARKQRKCEWSTRVFESKHWDCFL